MKLLIILGVVLAVALHQTQGYAHYCTGSYMYVNDYNCYQYYQCENNVWVLKNCPGSMAFHQTNQICTDPVYVVDCALAPAILLSGDDWDK